MDPEVLKELRSLGEKMDRQNDLLAALSTRITATEVRIDEWQRNIDRFYATEWAEFQSLESRFGNLRVDVTELQSRQPKATAVAAVGGGAGLTALVVEGIRMWLSSMGKSG